MTKKNFCLLHEEDKVASKKSHTYYYQVQAQHVCTKGSYCDFVVWTEKDFHFERITFDAALFREFIQQS